MKHKKHRIKKYLGPVSLLASLLLTPLQLLASTSSEHIDLTQQSIGCVAIIIFVLAYVLVRGLITTADKPVGDS